MNALLRGGPHNNKEMKVENNAKSIVFPIKPSPVAFNLSKPDYEKLKCCSVICDWYERGPITEVDGTPVALFTYKGQR